MFQNRKFTLPISLHLFYNLKPAFTISLLRIYDPLKQYYLFTAKRFLIVSDHSTRLFCFHAYLDPGCIPTTVVQPYPHLSKVFDQQLNDKALKINNTLAWQLYSKNEVVFLIVLIAAFFQRNIIDTIKIQFLNFFVVSYAHVTSFAQVS